MLETERRLLLDAAQSAYRDRVHEQKVGLLDGRAVASVMSGEASQKFRLAPGSNSWTMSRSLRRHALHAGESSGARGAARGSATLASPVNARMLPTSGNVSDTADFGAVIDPMGLQHDCVMGCLKPENGVAIKNPAPFETDPFRLPAPTCNECKAGCEHLRYSLTAILPTTNRITVDSLKDYNKCIDYCEEHYCEFTSMAIGSLFGSQHGFGCTHATLPLDNKYSICMTHPAPSEGCWAYTDSCSVPCVDAADCTIGSEEWGEAATFVDFDEDDYWAGWERILFIRAYAVLRANVDLIKWACCITFGPGSSECECLVDILTSDRVLTFAKGDNVSSKCNEGAWEFSTIGGADEDLRIHVCQCMFDSLKGSYDAAEKIEGDLASGIAHELAHLCGGVGHSEENHPDGCDEVYNFQDAFRSALFQRCGFTYCRDSDVDDGCPTRGDYIAEDADCADLCDGDFTCYKQCIRDKLAGLR